MSRSYKNYIVIKDKNNKFGKHLAVKSVRKDDSISNGKSYKKKYCSWNICDYRIFQGSFEEAIAAWKNQWKISKHLRKRFPVWKQAYRYYIANYRNK